MKHQSMKSKPMPFSLLLFTTCTSIIITTTNAFSLPSYYKPMGVRISSAMTTAGSAASTRLAVLPDVVVNAWDSYNVALENSPLITKSITAGVILGAADLSGQALEKQLSKNNNDDNYTPDEVDETGIDWARAIRFAIFGLALQAPWNHFYYLLLDGALPPTPEPFTATTGIKVVIDQFIQAPIFTVLIFFFLGLLEGKSIQNIEEQLENDYTDTMIANWKLWVPATVVNIAFCPPVLRVLYLNCVFYFWSIFLSLKLNSSDALSSSEEE